MEQSTILVVDDDDDLRVSIADLLELKASGHRVLGAASGEEALEVANEHRIDGVIMDFRLDGMDGLETLEALRRDHVDIGTIMLTAFPQLDMAQRGLNEGLIDRLLVKPIEALDLLEAIDEVLEAHHRMVANKRLFSQLRSLAWTSPPS